MCGITGFVSTRSLSEEDLYVYIDKMSSVLNHRGPDDTGAWVDKEKNNMDNEGVECVQQ